MLSINNQSPLSPRILELLNSRQNANDTQGVENNSSPVQNESNTQDAESNLPPAPISHLRLPLEILEMIFYYSTLSEENSVFPSWSEGRDSEVYHYNQMVQNDRFFNKFPRKYIHQLTSFMLVNSQVLAAVNGILRREENQQSHWIVKQMEFCHKNIRACLIEYFSSPEIFNYWAKEILNMVQHVAVTMKKFQDIPEQFFYAEDIGCANNSKNLLILLKILSSKTDMQTLNISSSFEPAEYKFYDDGDGDGFSNVDNQVFYENDMIYTPDHVPRHIEHRDFSELGHKIDSDILMEKIISIIDKNSQLRKINLSLEGCTMSADKVEKLMMQLLDKNIDELVLDKIQIGDDGAKVLSSYIKNIGLKTLRISSANISDIGVEYLSEAWPETLQILNLQSNDISEEGAKYLLDRLKDSKIKEVNLKDIYLPESLESYNESLERDSRSPINLYISEARETISIGG